MVFEALQDPDLEWLILDSTVVRAHPAAAGAKKARWDRRPSRTSAGPQSLRFWNQDPHRSQWIGFARQVDPDRGSGGRRDPSQSADRDIPFAVAIGDKGYDRGEVVDAIEVQGAPVIPSRKNRTVQRKIDWVRYKDRNLVERFWAKVKRYRRVATRFEKTARNFLAFVHVASNKILLR